MPESLSMNDKLLEANYPAHINIMLFINEFDSQDYIQMASTK